MLNLVRTRLLDWFNNITLLCVVCLCRKTLFNVYVIVHTHAARAENASVFIICIFYLHVPKTSHSKCHICAFDYLCSFSLLFSFCSSSGWEENELHTVQYILFVLRG